MDVFYIVLTLLFSALFSGTEIAFVSASKVKVELLRSKGTRRGHIISTFYEDPAGFIGMLLVGNNISLVIFSFLMTKLLTSVFTGAINSTALVLFTNTVIITIIVLLFGEFIPKVLFRLYADRILYALAYPLNLLKMILAIPSWIMIRLSNQLLGRIFQIPMDDPREAFTRADLELFIRDSLTEEVDDVEKDLMENALQLKNIKVRDCMIPRTEITHMDVAESIEELRELFVESNHSRIIVTRDDIDHVLGYVHHQQLWKPTRRIRDLVMQIPLVPDAMPVQGLLNRFIREQINIAWVVDEYGGTAGIITMEDILEEIFGEIEDEHDQEDHIETVISHKEFLFSGRLEINYLNDKYEAINLPEGDYNTLSGYVVNQAATIPEQGASIELDNYRFVLELVSDKKIELLRVIKLEPVDEEVAK